MQPFAFILYILSMLLMQGDCNADSIEQLTPEQQVTDARLYGTAEKECTGQLQAATEKMDTAIQQVVLARRALAVCVLDMSSKQVCCRRL